MAVVIRESVHHHKGITASKQDEVLSVFLLFWVLTEEAPLLFSTQNIVHSPWRPEIFHCFQKIGLKASHLQERAVKDWRNPQGEAIPFLSKSVPNRNLRKS
jgi:hypothetical protein